MSKDVWALWTGRCLDCKGLKEKSSAHTERVVKDSHVQRYLTQLRLARTKIYGVYTVFLAGKSQNKYTAVYGANIRLWPTMHTIYPL